MGRAVLAAVGVLLGLLALASGAVAEAPSALRGHGGPVKSLAPLSDGATLVTGSFDSAIILWDRTSGVARRVLRFHGSTVNAIAALKDGCFASGGEDARIAVWCGDGPTPQHVLEGHTAPVTQLAVSPDGRMLASVSFDRTVRLWALDGGSSRTLDTASAPLNALAFLPDGAAVVTGSYDGTVRIVPVDGGQPPATMSLGVPVNTAAVAADGRVLIAGADGHIRVLSRALTLEADIDLGNGPLTALAVTPDGRYAATAGMRTQVTLVDLAAGKVRFEILGPGLPVWTLAFSADGQELLTGGQDRTVRRWIAATGKPAGGDAGVEIAETLPLATERGAEVFRACVACHGVRPDETLKAGPTLAGLFGRRIATAPGYDYSEALKQMSIVWTPETFAELFTKGPMAYTPGTKMPEQRITDPADRSALIAWLQKVTAP